MKLSFVEKSAVGKLQPALECAAAAEKKKTYIESNLMDDRGQEWFYMDLFDFCHFAQPDLLTNIFLWVLLLG